MALSSYEKKAAGEVEAYFRSAEDGLLGRVAKTFFKPVEVVAERLIPDSVLEVAGNGVEAALKGIHSISDRTVDVESVLREARRHAEVVDTLADLRRQDLRVCDKVAEEVASKHGLIAALEGAGCGAGGLALLAADIPLLFGVAMRVVRQLAVAYGIDPAAPGESVIALKVFELASGGTRDRYAELLQLDALKDELDGLEPQKRAEKAAVLATMIMSREAVKRIVSLLLSRKLLQSVPVVGAAVGAGFNYLFVADVSETARQVYRRRLLTEKQKVEA
jgi:hypothetical protein